MVAGFSAFKVGVFCNKVAEAAHQFAARKCVHRTPLTTNKHFNSSTAPDCLSSIAFPPVKHHLRQSGETNYLGVAVLAYSRFMLCFAKSEINRLMWKLDFQYRKMTAKISLNLLIFEALGGGLGQALQLI